MTSSPTQKIDRLLGAPGTNLGDLLKKSQALTRLQHAITQRLDPDLAKHCSVINMQQGQVTIACDSAEWLTLLRFENPVLLQKLRAVEGLEHIASIRCKIIQREYKRKEKPRKRIVLSRLSAEHILAFAEQIKDPVLKKIFYGLAKRVF